MNFEYLVFDLDRTLLNDDRKISDFTFKVLTKLRENGKKIIYNTARGYGETMNVIRRFQPDYTICGGGSLILNNRFKTLFKSPIPPEFTNKLIKFFKKYNIHFTVQTYDKGYSDDQSLVRDTFIKVDYSFYTNDFAYKIDIYFKHSDDLLEKIKKEVAKYFLQLTPYSRPGCYRLNNIGDSKYNGLFELCKIEKISLAQVISFGDDINDLEMLLKSGKGVLVGNNNVHYNGNDIDICDTNNNEGPAKYLLKLFNL